MKLISLIVCAFVLIENAVADSGCAAESSREKRGLTSKKDIMEKYGKYTNESYTSTDKYKRHWGGHGCTHCMPMQSYYSQECNTHKKCPAKKYCHMFLCFDCLKENVACTRNGQCCRGLCTYGRCNSKSSKGDVGTFCDRHDDCSGDTCCVRIPEINPHISICKPTLDEFNVCGPCSDFDVSHISHFGDESSTCGPCKKALECKKHGIFGDQSICMKKDS